MKKTLARLLGFLFLAAALLRFPARAPASALDDLMGAAGQGMPNVPEPGEPIREDGGDNDRGDNDRRSFWQRRREEKEEREEQQRQQQWAAQHQQQLEAERRQQEEQARQETMRQQREEAARQERLRQEQLARERREQEERARQEALRRQQEEEARQARLRAQAAAARTQWAADDERNGSAFDDIFAGAAGSDPNVVDLTTATGRAPGLLRGGGSPVSLRTKAPPVPQPETTIDLREDPPEPPPPPPRWQLDWNQKFIDLGFAYASMYLKSKVDGLSSIPELSKDALDLHQRLREHTTGYLDKLFTTAGRATDPHADLGALSDQTWANFQTASANFSEDARRGAQNAVATTSSGALPEGSHAAEVGIGQGQAQLQDTQELVKWCEEHRSGRD